MAKDTNRILNEKLRRLAALPVATRNVNALAAARAADKVDAEKRRAGR